MIDFSELASLLGVFALAVVAPGVDFAFIVRESTGFGRRSGVMAAWGLATSILVHVTYTVLGVGLVVSQSILAFNIIKWAGAAYLIFIGVMSLRAPAPAPVVEAEPKSKGRSLLRSFGMGFLTNLLNPKAALFFVSLFTVLVSHDTSIPVQFGYGAVMAMMVGGWFSLVAVFFTTKAIRAAYARAGRWINRATGAVFIVFGLRLALQRATP